MKNRLNLDFSIEKAEDRSLFVENYLNNIDFQPNETELETIANYVLWGKNEQGLNSQQEGSIKIKEWNPTTIESLESLVEQPEIKETSFHDLSYPATRVPRLNFNRKESLRLAPDYLVSTYQALFKEIDKTDLIINFYECSHGKRTEPPRKELLDRFSEEEISSLEAYSAKINQYKYLKLRHYLVELRREQYTLRDTYNTPIGFFFQGMPGAPIETAPLSIEDIVIKPAGLFDDSIVAQKVFSKEFNPNEFNKEELKQFYNRFFIDTNLELDLSNENHMLNALKMRADLEEQKAQATSIENSSNYFLRTLQFYIEQANLNESQTEILNYKLQKRSNIVIADLINEKYGKHYNDNYISTIFHQKIIPEICKAVEYHQKLIDNIENPNAFKVCKDCGRVMLKDPRNFMRFQKSKDGFSTRCKSCEKLKRGKKNGIDN